MAVENYTNVTNLEDKMMRWRPKKPTEKKNYETDLISPGEVARLIDELTLNSIALSTQKEELNKIQEELHDLRVQYDDIYLNAPVGYLTIDRSGLIFQANLFIASLLVVEKPSLLGVNLNGFIPPDSQDAFYSFLEKVFVTKSLQSCVICLRKNDGSLCFSKLDGVYVNNSGSSEPIPLCRVAVLPCQANTAAENDKIIEKSTVFQDQKIEPPMVVGSGIQAMTEKVQHAKLDLQDSLKTTARMVEMRDYYSVGHQQKVSKLAIALARELGLTEDQTRSIGIAALVHDIGKINTPAEILNRKGNLADRELQQIRDHVRSGHDILKTMGFPPSIANIVLQHHERLDGSGYPFGLKGDDILLESRILAVADSIEAMCSQRAHRPAMNVDEALEELYINKGLLYDTDVVQSCLSLFRDKGFDYQ